MAVINTEIICEATVDLIVVPTMNKNFDRPESGVRPWETVTVIPDDAPLLDGEPTYAPYWVRCSPLLSSEGQYYFASRPFPGDVDLGSTGRWIADPARWDPTTGTWSDWNNPDNALQWVASNPMLQPGFSNVTYTLGREVITVPQMTFTGVEGLSSVFSTPALDAMGWTLSMVIMPGSPTTLPMTLMDWVNNTSDPALSTTLRPFINIINGSQSGSAEYGWGGSTNTLSTTIPLTRLRPCFVTLVVNPPEVTLYISGGASYTVSTATTSQLIRTTPLTFSLMKSGLATQTHGVLSLLEVAFWGGALTKLQVNELNAKYTSAYGASVEWS